MAPKKIASKALGYQESYFPNRNDMLQSALDSVLLRYSDKMSKFEIASEVYQDQAKALAKEKERLEKLRVDLRKGQATADAAAARFNASQKNAASRAQYSAANAAARTEAYVNARAEFELEGQTTARAIDAVPETQKREAAVAYNANKTDIKGGYRAIDKQFEGTAEASAPGPIQDVTKAALALTYAADELKLPRYEQLQLTPDEKEAVAIKKVLRELLPADKEAALRGFVDLGKTATGNRMPRVVVDSVGGISVVSAGGADFDPLIAETEKRLKDLKDPTAPAVPEKPDLITEQRDEYFDKFYSGYVPRYEMNQIMQDLLEGKVTKEEAAVAVAQTPPPVPPPPRRRGGGGASKAKTAPNLGESYNRFSTPEFMDFAAQGIPTDLIQFKDLGESDLSALEEFDNMMAGQPTSDPRVMQQPFFDFAAGGIPTDQVSEQILSSSQSPPSFPESDNYRIPVLPDDYYTISELAQDTLTERERQEIIMQQNREMQKAQQQAFDILGGRGEQQTESNIQRLMREILLENENAQRIYRESVEDLTKRGGVVPPGAVSPAPSSDPNRSREASQRAIDAEALRRKVFDDMIRSFGSEAPPVSAPPPSAQPVSRPPPDRSPERAQRILKAREELQRAQQDAFDILAGTNPEPAEVQNLARKLLEKQAAQPVAPQTKDRSPEAARRALESEASRQQVLKDAIDILGGKAPVAPTPVAPIPVAPPPKTKEERAYELQRQGAETGQMRRDALETFRNEPPVEDLGPDVPTGPYTPTARDTSREGARKIMQQSADDRQMRQDAIRELGGDIRPEPAEAPIPRTPEVIPPVLPPKMILKPTAEQTDAKIKLEAADKATSIYGTPEFNKLLNTDLGKAVSDLYAVNAAKGDESGKEVLSYIATEFPRLEDQSKAAQIVMGLSYRDKTKGLLGAKKA